VFDAELIEAELGEATAVEWGVVNKSEEDKGGAKKLSEKFIIPPFSVLNTASKDWVNRNNYWMSLGIKSEIGRDAESYTNNDKLLGDGTKFSTVTIGGVSIFDPVLCELSYNWFNVPNGNILDPFAGGSVRGIVASKLGYNYLGNDLSEKQIEANRINASEVLEDSEMYPIWTIGDSLNIDKIADNYNADLIFSCPPYADLEVYSDKKEDISNMDYKDFIKSYNDIIKKSCEKLNNDRFAVFVVGDVRDKKGFYRNFISDTISAFLSCGLMLYNEMILVNKIGNLHMRAGRYFNSSRKIGKMHQNVLVFYKGNHIWKTKMNIPKNHKEFIRLVADGTAQDEAYRLTSPNKSLTKATSRVEGSKLAKKYALEIQQAKEKASDIVEQANNDKDVQIALKSILTKAEVDAVNSSMIKGELYQVQMVNSQGKIWKAMVSPTIAERQKAIDTYYKRFGLNEAQKQELTINKGFYFDLENDGE
jgi:hypothetical protein